MSALDRPRRMRGLLTGEVPITRVELDRLHAVERAHDHYAQAVAILARGSEAMRVEGSEYAAGWLACLRLLYNTTIGS